MKTLVRLVAVLAIVVARAVPAGAADSGWAIDSFHADITVRSSGTLEISEAIDADFGGLQKHGIFRDIPTRYRYDDSRDRTYALVVDGVTDPSGRAIPYQVTKGDAVTQIKIGDPNRTVSGKQGYRIRYSVAGALNAFPDHGELYWNVNGASWGVPTSSASATVTAPLGAVERVACFAGPTGSTHACTSALASPGGAAFTSQGLAPEEQLTIVVGLKTGAVNIDPPSLVQRPRGFVDYFATTPQALAAATVVLIGGLFLVWRLWWTRGRDQGRPRGAIVAEYEPPAKLRPAQLGVIVDESADPRDLVATIVDLAVRGYLTITEHPKHGLFGSPDWTLDRMRAGDALLPYERTLFDGLFVTGPSVLVSSLKGTFAPTLKSAEQQLYDDGKENGWFVADPSRVRTAYAGLGCLTAALGFGAIFLLGSQLGWGLVGIAVGVVGIAVLLLSRGMPARTGKGAALLAQTLGFKRYMDTAETDRAAFAEKEGLFTAYLPYAIMFASVDRWMRAFAGLDTEKAVSSFYMGSGPFSAATFGSSFSGFSDQLASTVTATPAGSGRSGFSGGGFSGGGGGGGGGGSW